MLSGRQGDRGLDERREEPASVSPAGVTARRRRGAQLNEAIYEACIDELRESGYLDLTMDKVAARARTGKATLYRRWPSKVELVADALQHTVPVFEPPPDTGRLRDELLALLEAVSDDLAGPNGAAARGFIAEAVRNPELFEMLPGQDTDPMLPAMMEVLRRAVVRRDVSAAALTPRVARVGSELLMQHFLTRGAPIPRKVLVEIVDEVILPLLKGID
jgi:AcrR family transcriptional regulator